MATLIDRLVGYDPDAVKLPIHQFVDSIDLLIKGYPQVPTVNEIQTAFGLTNDEKDDAVVLRDLIVGGTRSIHDVKGVLRIAEMFPDAFPKSRVLAVLGL